MDELKNFTQGGMDTDSAPDAVAPSDYLSAFNIRLSGTAEGEGGYVTNIESTEYIGLSRPTGLNKAIGAAGFETIRKALGFIYNSQGFHQIVELDYDTLTEDVIFTNKTDSAGIDILPLNPEYRICDIKLINDQFLVFTDGRMQVCYIDYNKLKSGGYGTLTQEDFSLMKAQPLKVPTAVYNNDSTRSYNLSSKKLFQFTYYNTYDGYEESTLATYSKRPVPINEATPTEGTDVTKSNNLIVTVDIGSNRVKTINIAARYDSLDWFIIKTIDRSEILAITDTSVDVANEVYEAYNPTENTYSFAFYNDGLYQNLPVLYTDLEYDRVPHTCETLEVVNNNILLLGNVTEGYTRPIVDVLLSVGSIDPNIKNPPPDESDDLFVRYFVNTRISGSHRRLVTIYFSGNVKTGDEITIVTSNLDGVVVNTTTYVVHLSQNNNTLAAIQSLAAAMPYPTAVYQQGSDVVMEYKTNSYEKMLRYTLNLANIGTGKSTSIHALKTNSSYQLSLAHYDKSGVYMPISTGNNFVVNTPSFAQIQGATPIISWQILSDPPAGAVSAQWLITKNNTHENTLYITGEVDSGLSTTDYLVVKINPLLKFNTVNSSSILNYSYSEGDRVTFVSYLTVDNTIWYNSPGVDVEVVDFTIEVDTTPDPDETNYLLKIRKPSSVETADLLSKNILFEIYTPRKRASVVDGTLTYAATVFYEIGEQILITNGAYATTSGSITDGDVYYKTREIADATDLNDSDSYVVEDFNFSDYYISNYYSLGRARTYFDTPERIQRKASIRYSDTFIVGSKNNGLTRFYGERIYGEGAGQTSSNYGGIYKLFMRDNFLVCLQEFKVGHIPVNLSILEDQAEQQNVAISDKLLNNVRYATGKWGIGRAKESFAASKSGDIYFIDPNNSLPIRDGANGVIPISGKMSKYFQRVLQQSYAQGKKIPCWFDDFNTEYAVSIETQGDILQTIIFNPANWDLENDYTVVAASLAQVSATNGTLSINTTTGIGTFTPTTGYSGSAGFVFSFTNNLSQSLQKNACITVIAGDKTPNGFLFIDLTDQPLNTLKESNSVLISGINIPTSISISSGQYQINGGTWTSTAGFINDGDTAKVRVTSSGSGSTAVSATLTVGTVSDTFTVTTAAGGVPIAELLVVDLFYNDTADNFLGIITLPVVTDLAYTGSNFVHPADTAADALILASDYIYSTPLNNRFLFNIENMLADFPTDDDFTFKIKGRATVAGTVDGAYGTYTGNPSANMGGSPGTYQPYRGGGSELSGETNFTATIDDGADGTYDDTLPDIITFTYNRITNVFTATPA